MVARIAGRATASGFSRARPLGVRCWQACVQMVVVVLVLLSAHPALLLEWLGVGARVRR